MRISVIICTIRRPSVIRTALDCLAAQSHREFEVLVVGGEQGPGLEEERALPPLPGLRFLAAPPGLARARNVGLEHASGDLVCFLDDDVSFGSDFLAHVVRLFESAELAGAGGLTGYDTLNYPQPVPMRWRLRMALGIAPSLNPGDSSPLGRSVTFSFFHPFPGLREVRWLPGFCQIFRREAIDGLRYDEATVAEDRDFSMTVGERWRLVICGDLHLQHHLDREGRPNAVRQTRRAAFALGRSFAKRRRGLLDWLRMFHVLAGEFLIDVLVAIRKPSTTACGIIFGRIDGFVGGIASVTAKRFHGAVAKVSNTSGL